MAQKLHPGSKNPLKGLRISQKAYNGPRTYKQIIQRASIGPCCFLFYNQWIYDHVMDNALNQDMNIDVIHGRMDTPEEEERLRRLHRQLEIIVNTWSYISPAPDFKITKDRHGQVHVKMNERMLSYLLVRFGEVEAIVDAIKPEDPPEWFMKLMGGEEYERPAGNSGI